jgi:hypothetical protein
MEHKILGNPCLNIVFDDRQPDDYGRLLGEFIEQEITKYIFHPCIVDKDSVVKSINLSHKMIVQKAKDNGYDMCLIAEQDVTFTHPTSWKYFIDSIPESFDIFLWGSYIVPLSNNRVCGFHLYAIHANFYDVFLASPDNVHIDTYMDELGGDYKFCEKAPALQRAGFSANNRAFVDYNKILEEKDIYRG